MGKKRYGSNKVDLVLFGHDHSYVRSKSLKAGVQNPDGTVYLEGGGCASKQDSAKSELADYEEITSTPAPTKKSIKVRNLSVSCNMNITAGKTAKLSVSIAPSNATKKTLTYSSSNTAVATVNSKGTITAKSCGKTTIQVKAKDGSNVTKKITIYIAPKGLSKLSVKQTKNKTKLQWKSQKNVSGYFIYKYNKNKKSYVKQKTHPFDNPSVDES